MKTRLLLRLTGAALAGAFVFGLPVALFAQNAASYIASANGKFQQGDYDGAIADYTKALELNSSYISAYNGRGLAWRNNGNFDGAIADFSAAIRLKPTMPEPYLNRSVSEFMQGNFDGAIADCTKLIDMDPTYQSAFFYRAVMREAQTNLAGADEDYTKAISLKATSDDWTHYAILYKDLFMKRGGNADDENLKAYLNWSTEWTKWLAKFLDGKITEEGLLKVADTAAGDKAAHRCEALYFAGSVKAIGGDKAGARADFQQCVNVDALPAIVHKLAQVQLDRL